MDQPSQRLLVDADAAIQQYAAELADVPPLGELPTARPIRYRGYRELLNAWAALRNARSQIVGRSVLGEPIWMVEIGNPEAKNLSVVLAGIHPIEWIGVETALAIAMEHALEPCQDRRVCFFPLVNPDGFRLVEDALRNGRRKWVRANANRVDLNRNWPTHFRHSRGFYAGHNRSGPKALSEPEVSAIVETLDAMVETGSNIDIALSLHSIGKMILVPWGGKWGRPEAFDRHVRVARSLRRSLRGYTIRQVSRWVPGISFAHGMEIDHLYGAYGATSLLVECTRGELSWKTPGALFHPFRIFNPQDGFRDGSALAKAVDPFVRGEL